MFATLNIKKRYNLLFPLFLIFLFYIFGPAKVTTLPGGKHEQSPGVVVTIFLADVDNITMQHGDHTMMAY